MTTIYEWLLPNLLPAVFHKINFVDILNYNQNHAPLNYTSNIPSLLRAYITQTAYAGILAFYFIIILIHLRTAAARAACKMTCICFNWLKQFILPKPTIKTTSVPQHATEGLRDRCRNSPQENPGLRDWLTSELLAPFVMFWPNTWEILPKVWSPPYQTSQIQVSKHDDGKIQKRLPLFTTLCLWFGIVSVWVHHVGVERLQEVEGQGGGGEGTPGSPISWKVICDPLMKSFSFGIKLNVQRYLSVGISLIAPREVSDRLMQVLTWASPRILYMYPATDRYC